MKGGKESFFLSSSIDKSKKGFFMGLFKEEEGLDPKVFCLSWIENSLDDSLLWIGYVFFLHCMRISSRKGNLFLIAMASLNRLSHLDVY